MTGTKLCCWRVTKLRLKPNLMSGILLYCFHFFMVWPGERIRNWVWWTSTKEELYMQLQFLTVLLQFGHQPLTLKSILEGRDVIFGQRNRQFPFFKADSKDSWNKLEQCKGWRLLHVLWQGTDILFHYDKLAWLND